MEGCLCSPLCVHIAGIEFAILDMLGNIANKPVGLLIGDMLNPKVSIYLGHHLSKLRKSEPEESLQLMKRDVLETKAKAKAINGAACFTIRW